MSDGFAILLEQAKICLRRRNGLFGVQQFTTKSGKQVSINWEEIRRVHAPSMWRIAWRILKHEADSLDCCQEVFAEAVERSRNPDQPIENWSAFLCWLTTRRAIDALRKKSRTTRPRLLGEQDVFQLDAKARVGDAAETEELNQWIRNELAEMPKQMAESFWFCCIEGMSYRDAAEQLQTSTNQIGVNIHRAREILKRRLSKLDLDRGSVK